MPSTHIRILNIGAGDGSFEHAAKQKGWDVVTLEPDHRTVERLSEAGIRAFQGYIEQMPFSDGRFDVVVASEVLEHLDTAQLHRGIHEVVRVMYPSGLFIGTVPYKEDLLQNQAICPDCGKVFHRWGHTRAFSRRSLRKCLSPFFQHLSTRRMAFADFKHRSVLGMGRSLLRGLLGRFGLQITSPNIYFVARLS